MGWTGTLRAIQAAQSRAEREDRRRLRELQKQAEHQGKLNEQEQARLEVETYENRLALLLSIHKEEVQVWRWEAIRDTSPPTPPNRVPARENAARRHLASLGPAPEPPTQRNSREEAALTALAALPPLPAPPSPRDWHEAYALTKLQSLPLLPEPERKGIHEAEIAARKAQESPQPEPPIRHRTRELPARERWEAKRPNLLGRLFGKKSEELLRLEAELEQAMQADEAVHQEATARYDEVRRRDDELDALLAEARQADEARFQAEWQEYQQHLAAKAELEQEVAAGRQSDAAEFQQAWSDYEQLVARQQQLGQSVPLAREADEADYQRAVAEWQQRMAERAAAEAQVEAGRQMDERNHQAVWQPFVTAEQAWRESHALALAVLAGERDAYAHVLRELSPFQEISSLGSRLDFHIHAPKLIEVGVKVNGEQAIPSRVTSLTATGKVSVKAMPTARFHEIYQDYVCGCILRIGREVLALLPVETVLVTAMTDVTDSRTGLMTEQPILSVAMPRVVMQTLNFTHNRRGAPLDPSDAMDNFMHRGDFRSSRRSGAFVPIVPLRPEDLPAALPGQPGSASTAAPVNPFAAKWAESLRRNEIEFGFLRLTANELAGLLGRPAQDNFTLPESKALAREVERYGYCLEPDARHGAGNFWGNREVGLFQPPSGAVQAPSEHFQGAAALLQLCLLVAAADGSVDRSELDQFRKFIESQFQFTPDEHQRLIVLETLLARNAASAKVTLGRTAKCVPQEKHIVIAQFLVDVAAVDGVISPKEHKAMARIFEALGLSEDTLDILIRNLAATGREVVIQSAEPTRPGEPIPVPGKRDFSAPLKLDMARVAAISAETHEVIGLLAKAMAEEETTAPAARRFGQSEMGTMPDEEAAQMPQVGDTAPHRTGIAPVETIATAMTAATAMFDSLDLKYRAVVVRLVVRDTWSRAEFEALAWEHQLMPLSVFDAINEWADQQLGDFLLEGEATIIIHRNLLTP